MWYQEQLHEKAAGETMRVETKEAKALLGSNNTIVPPEGVQSTRSTISEPPISVGLPEGLEIIEAEPIMDRKSSFVGRACRITSPDQVVLV